MGTAPRRIHSNVIICTNFRFFPSTVQMNKSILCSNQLSRTPITTFGNSSLRLAGIEGFEEIMRLKIDVAVKHKYYQFKLVIVLVDGGTSHLKMIVCLVRKPVKLHANHENTHSKLNCHFSTLVYPLRHLLINLFVINFTKLCPLLFMQCSFERRDSGPYFVGGKLLCMMRTIRIQRPNLK